MKIQSLLFFMVCCCVFSCSSYSAAAKKEKFVWKELKPEKLYIGLHRSGYFEVGAFVEQRFTLLDGKDEDRAKEQAEFFVQEIVSGKVKIDSTRTQWFTITDKKKSQPYELPKEFGAKHFIYLSGSNKFVQASAEDRK